MRWILGIALVVASCSKARDEVPPPPVPEPVTPQALASQFDRCWGHYNAARWDAYKACFAPNARIEKPGFDDRYLDVDEIIAEAKQHPDERAELQLVASADTMVIGVVKLGKRHVVDVVDYDVGRGGLVVNEQRYFDAAIPRTGPLAIGATKRVVIGAGAPAEQENAAVVGRMFEAWNGPGLDELIANDVVWSEPWFDGNLDRARLYAHLDALRPLVFDARVTTTWFAGDFVVVRGKIEGHVESPVPSVGIDARADGRFSVPFVAIFEVARGKVRAASFVWQTASLYQQIGIPPRTTPLPLK